MKKSTAVIMILEILYSKQNMIKFKEKYGG